MRRGSPECAQDVRTAVQASSEGDLDEISCFRCCSSRHWPVRLPPDCRRARGTAREFAQRRSPRRRRRLSSTSSSARWCRARTARSVSTTSRPARITSGCARRDTPRAARKSPCRGRRRPCRAPRRFRSAFSGSRLGERRSAQPVRCVPADDRAVGPGSHQAARELARRDAREPARPRLAQFRVGSVASGHPRAWTAIAC